ncbi:MAG TPA: NHLP bacteriocin export ABC transporter permease/ATPase subunit [Stellaceae bacterium]|jgi:ATP-binding cassette subfamily C protein|nr:NHLP bacteriocin export ABC transporter permease/ATPase subunit [Stellaceae bacterium]
MAYAEIIPSETELPEPDAGDRTLAILELLEVGGAVQQLGANQPFDAGDPDKVWIVVAGAIDLFLAPSGIADDGKEGSADSTGTRHHILRISEGDLFFGLNTARRPLQILAVPTLGCEIVEAPRDRVLAFLKHEDVGGEAIDLLIQRWIERIAVDQANPALPAMALQLVPGLAATLPEGSSILPAGETAIIEAPAGALTLGGSIVVDQWIDREIVTVPVHDNFWFTLRQELSVTPLTVAEWMQRPDFADGLAVLHDLVLAATAKAAVAREEHFGETIVQSRLYGETRFSGALRTLVGIVSTGQRNLAPPSGNPLIAAASLVYQALGGQLRLTSVEEETIASSRDPIGEIGRITGFLYRRVTLTGNWWRRDHGPILTWYGEDQRPCAIVSSSPRRYWLVDGATAERRRLTDEVARTVSPNGYTFVLPFPTGRLQPFQLLVFGARVVWRDAWWVVGTIIATGLLTLVMPVVTGWIMDPVIPEGDFEQLMVLTTALVVSGISTTGLNGIQSISMLRIEGAMNQRVQAAVWDRLLKLPVSFFRAYSIGDLANRAMSIDQIRQIFSGTVTASLTHGVSGLFSLALIFYYNWLLALFGVFIAVIFVGISYLIGRAVKKRNREITTLTGSLQGLVVQLLNGVPRLRLSGADRSAFARWAERYVALTLATYRQARLNNLATVFRSFFNYMGPMTIFLVIGFSTGTIWEIFYTKTSWSDMDPTIITKFIAAGDFVAFNVAFANFMQAVFGMSQTALALLNVPPLYDRVRPILDEPEETRDDASEDPGQIEGNVEIRDVFFRYRSDLPLVLKGLSVTAERGQFIAIVGPSGAGKSSLVRLLLGFDQAEQGSIFIDSKDVRYLNKRALRRQIGVVLQSGRILSGSVFHNITAGANMTRDDAWEAARIAGLDNDIKAMPMGMDTFLNEGATTISGGQRQRLMIARAVARRPKLLIFDEATSALDNVNQETVSRNLETLKSTRIVIAHRLSTIAHADIIYVVVGGVIVEAGNFESLMAKEGVFADLAKRQMA